MFIERYELDPVKLREYDEAEALEARRITAHLIDLGQAQLSSPAQALPLTLSNTTSGCESGQNGENRGKL
jgi:hypothetical protein